jgi:hypothetical protein
MSHITSKDPNALYELIRQHKETIQPYLSQIETILEKGKIKVVLKSKEFVIENGLPNTFGQEMSESFILAGYVTAIKKHQLRVIEQLTQEKLAPVFKEKECWQDSYKTKYKMLGKLSSKSQAYRYVTFVQNVETDDIFVNVYDEAINMMMSTAIAGENFYILVHKYLYGRVNLDMEPDKSEEINIRESIVFYYSKPLYRKIMLLASKIELITTPYIMSQIKENRHIIVNSAVHILEKHKILRKLEDKETSFGKRLNVYESTLDRQKLAKILKILDDLIKE